MGKYTPKQIKKKYDYLKGNRGTWETHWQDLSDYILPRKDNINKTTTPGEKKRIQLLDNSAMQANELLAGALHGLLTNPNSTWFELTTGDLEIDNADGVRQWLQDSARRMHLLLNNTNFQTEVHELYLDLCCFGTGPMTIEEDDDKIIIFGSRTIGEVVVDENNKGFVDEMYREFEWNARQIVNEFGFENVGDKVQKCYTDDREDKFKIIHAVYPQRNVDGKQAGQFAYMSHYVLHCDEIELRVKGFRELPFVCPRWSKITGEIYGRSPGMIALPEAKTLNKMTEVMIIGAQKVVDPPLQAPDDGFVLPIITKPGSMNYYRAGSNDRIQPIFNDTRLDFGQAAMGDRRQRIREAYYVDQLQLSNGPQMTATEVMQRTEERMRLLGPMLGRLQSEFLSPLIDRVFAIMLRRNMFTEFPAELRGRDLTVQYSSMIARTQRMNEGNNITRTIQAAAPFLQMDQTAIDNFNIDNAVRTIANIFGLPQEMLKDKKEVAQVREARAKAQQEAIAMQKKQQEMEEANKAADTMSMMQGMGGMSGEGE